jgi:gluconokinase
MVMTVIVAGVSGCGKTTVGELLAQDLGWQFIDGDSLHPPANIAKMARGEPLTDQDRAPWLRLIGERIDAEQAAGRRSVVACSALKRQYRSELLDGRPLVSIAFLMIDYQVARDRLAGRRGHFFDPRLLDSQFASLEPPDPGEARVLPVPVRDSPAGTVEEIIRELGLADKPGVMNQ